MTNVQVEAADFETATAAVKNMGLGWNLGNTLEANRQSVTTDVTSPDYWGQQGLESETCWGQYVTHPELLKMMKDAGFGAIRVPVTWYNHMDKDGNVNAEWMARVHEVVDYVINQGMYCILNVHHDTGADSYDKSGNLTHYHWIKADEDNYSTNKARYEKLWKQIAEEFKNYDQHLLFEGYNEMLDKLNSWCYASFASSKKYDAEIAASAYNAINSYAQSFVSTVRTTGGNNEKRNLIVNTYACCAGIDTWSEHLKDPLKEMKYPTDTAEGHIIFQVHAYPSIVVGTKDRPIASIQSEIDAMINDWKTYLVSKGAPVILGEWGTSNVDADVTDYDARRPLMFEFADYMVKQCKANDVATFYWMGLTEGAARLFPAFHQADLAKVLLQAYHGSDYDPVLPVRSDYNNTYISATVGFEQEWSEFNIFTGTMSASDYSAIELELAEAPATGALQYKVYGSSEKFQKIETANSKLSLTTAMGSIKQITLQWCLKSKGSVKVKSIWLVKKDGTKIPSDPSVFWGCTMSDVTLITLPTGVNSIKMDAEKGDGYMYDLNGRRLQQPSKGITIKNGKKYFGN